MLNATWIYRPIGPRILVFTGAGGKSNERYSCCLQLARVSDFSCANRTGLRGFHGSHCCRVSVQRGEFHFIGETVPINMHDRSHVARFQSFSGEIALQNDSVMFFDRFTFHALCGYAVTNLATSTPLSTIQIVCTSAAFPTGDLIRPTITYFWPWGDVAVCVTSAWCANFCNAFASVSGSAWRKPSSSINAAFTPLSGCAAVSN